jgi:hypothetical protein
MLKLRMTTAYFFPTMTPTLKVLFIIIMVAPKCVCVQHVCLTHPSPVTLGVDRSIDLG